MATPGPLHTSPVTADGATPDRWALLLHGIYGRGRNWSAVAKQITAVRPEWGFWLTDLRLHGESPGMNPPHTIAAVADDVATTARALSAQGTPLHAVLGHSFGGKVALSLTPALADALDQVWVIDSTPEARTPDGSAWQMLEIVRALPAPFPSRAAGIAALEEQGLTTGVATWMSTNLRRTDDGFVWALDFDALELLLRDFFASDLWPLVERPPGHVSLHFVKAHDSSTLGEAACARIERLARETGRVHLHRIAGGHWVNTDNPAAIVALLGEHLG